MKWEPDIACNLTWGQIASLNSGLKELNESEETGEGNKEQGIEGIKDLNIASNKKHNEIMVKKVLDSKRPDGTVDLGKVFSPARR